MEYDHRIDKINRFKNSLISRKSPSANCSRGSSTLLGLCRGSPSRSFSSEKVRSADVIPTANGSATPVGACPPLPRRSPAHLQIYATRVPLCPSRTSSLLIGAMLSGRAGVGCYILALPTTHASSTMLATARFLFPAPPSLPPHPTGAADHLLLPPCSLTALHTQDVSAKPRFFSGIAGTRTMIGNSRRCRHRTWTNRSWSATRCVAAVARNHSTGSQKETLGWQLRGAGAGCGVFAVA